MRVDACDNLQKRRPFKALSPNDCIMCFKDRETASHLFLHCDFARFLWGKLLGIMDESWFSMDSILDVLLLKKVGFGRQKEERTLLNCVVLVLLSSRVTGLVAQLNRPINSTR